MKLPAYEQCQTDPILTMLYNNDSRGYLNKKRGSNKSFLNRRRIDYSLELLLKHLSADKSSPIADFACGNANFGIQLGEMGYAVDLIDNEAKHFDYVKLKTDQHQQFSYHVADINSYSTEKKYFALFLGEAIEHMENPEETLKTLREHLLPGGLLCLTTPNGDFVHGNEPKWHEVKEQKERNAKLANNLGNHVCEFGFDELARLMKEVGFGILEHKLINSDQISRHSLLRRILPNALLCKLDYIWSHSKNKDNKFWGRTQVIVAQRFH